MSGLEFTEATARRLERLYLTNDVVAQRAETLRRLVVSRGERVLDVGCGSGRWVRYFTQRFTPKFLMGVDFTQASIDLLKKQGLIDELDLLHLRGDRHYYESHGPRDHIHVACLRCGKVREFESRLYEQLKEQIARDFHMKVTISRTEVGGYCADCIAAVPSLAETAKPASHSDSANSPAPSSHPSRSH